jgi:hypothetical protein
MFWFIYPFELQTAFPYHFCWKWPIRLYIAA